MAQSIARFVGKVAIVTGASSGIGYGTALRFAREKVMGLTVSGRNLKALDQLASDCQKEGLSKNDVLVVVGDICDAAIREKVIQQTIDRFGRLDILVNNAGIISMGTCEATSLQAFNELMAINVKAPFHLTQLAIPHLRSTKGNIINVSSVNGIRSFSGVCAYNMSKAALDQMTKCVALEVAVDGIRCNSVNPGVVITELQRRAGLSEEAYQAFLENSKRSHPLGRPGTVDEVAACIAFLASDEASFCTGNLHSVDGGRGVLGVR